MKKHIILLLLVLICSSCGQKPQRTFTIENRSGWRVVVTATDVDELGRRQRQANYVIGEHGGGWRKLSDSAIFNLYEYGDCNLLSVNGAKITSKTDRLMILENASPEMVRVVNTTGKDVFIKNEPYLGGALIDFNYDGTWKDADGNLHTDYRPIFEAQVVTRDRTQSNPLIIPMHAWQLFEIKDPYLFKDFAKKHILITVNGLSTRAELERSGDSFFLYIRRAS